MRKAVQAFIDDVRNRLDNRSLSIDREYRQMERNLIRARQLVAAAIMSEKRLETEVDRCKNQAKVWQGRADMGKNRGDDDMYSLCLERRDRYETEAIETEKMVLDQKAITEELKQRLLDELERPQRFVFLLKFLIDIFPDEPKLPPGVRMSVKEIINSCGEAFKKLNLDRPHAFRNQDLRGKHKIAYFEDSLLKLIDRSCEALTTTADYYAKNQDKAEASTLFERILKAKGELDSITAKAHEEYSTWMNRVEMAKRQGNDDLAMQAQKRADMHSHAMPYKKVFDLLDAAIAKRE